jgi:putative DNA primase/helicase
MSAAAFEDWKRRAKSADILAVAVNTLGLQLKRHAGELIGACPLGCSKRDGFSINTKKQVFNCRGAGIGGDVIDMMMHVGGLNYFAACETILAEPPPGRGTQLTPDQIAAAEKQKAEGKALAARRAADENLYRENARRQAFDVYKHAHALAGSSAEQYLKRRGLRFPATPEGRAERIKCVEAMPYFHGAGDKAEVIHRGPAMVLPIVDQARKPRGLHLTYLDLAQPKGKLQLVHEGELLDAKKTRGSKHGNKVELIGPAEPTTLYLGEGAEKVIAVWQALAWRAGLFDDEETRAILSVDRIAGAMCDHRCEALDRTAFWSACDLGNLAGKAADSVRHPTAKSPSGRAQRVAGGVPDLDAPAIVIPQSVTELVLLGDSTSDEFTTRLAMQRAAARYAAPGRRVRVAWAPHGKDFDDLWREGAIDAAVTICGILDSAQESIPQRISSTGSNNPSDSSPARSSDSEPGAPQQTSAGNAGAPLDLPSDRADPIVDPAAAALGPAAPPSSPAGEMSERSRTGSFRVIEGGRGGGGRGGGHDDETPGDRNRRLAFFQLSDIGNVKRFVARFGGDLKYCPALGWLYWDGRRWSREGAEGRATIAEHETAVAIQAEAEAIEGTGLDEELVDGKGKRELYSEKLRRWGRQSENASRLNPISTRARPYLAVQPHELDADPLKINVANGTLVVRRDFKEEPPADWLKVSDCIRLKPHDPADLITKISPVEFDAGATCPEYDAFLDLVQPSVDLQRFIDDFDGYSLTGDASEQALVFHYGTGKNGKSTQINIKLHIAGDYGKSVPIDTFAQGDRARQAGQATPDLAMLHRVRYVSTSEPSKNWKLDEGLIKVLTGGDEVPVRELFAKSYFMLKPEFKLGMNGNFKPRIDGGEKDSGIWRRIKLVPWLVKIPADKRDKHFGEKLKAEAPGVLNRMLRGLERWVRGGLRDPIEVAEATEKFRQDSDPLGRFLDFCTKPDADGLVQTTALFNLFEAWAKAFGEAVWKPTGFGRAMHERGYETKKISSNFWVGIATVKSVNDFVDHEGRPLVLGEAPPGGGSDAAPAPGPSPDRGGGRGARRADDDDEGF